MSEETNPIIPKQFDYREAERRIYRLWEEHNVFRAEPEPARPAFCVVIPPPNVTGILHMGHVLDNVPQDIVTRWHRMRGFAALWMPGTDHAGIATQNVVERQLAKEGTSARALGREAFVQRVWEWREKHGSIIINQLKRLGCSCDWSRERFTMDAQMSRAVLAAFIHYYDRGLIYRGTRMINWCPRCRTALANEEAPHENRSGHLWHLRYPLADEPARSLVVATTRPETMLGDTAVAVNPDDERYRGLIGREILLPLQNRRIPVIADAFVDPAFGTGAVKVTPAHDPNDYQMGIKHQLPLEVVIDEEGRMTHAAGPRYAGKDRFEARKAVVADLESQGLLEKVEPYVHAVGECYRCATVVEPLVSQQWFVKMRPLGEKARQAVLDGQIVIVPESERNDYFSWLDNIQDWCISRQLWWGHRIPVYYCRECEEVMAAAAAPDRCRKCGSQRLEQDPDVLDTWFSSQLWPFATLGWPDQTPDLRYWYPNSWLMSGRDILFFWDARMIMAGLELCGDVPFRTLALHGIARDDQGRKLSKSLGNSPDPIDLFEQHGTDAIRASVMQRYPMGRQDIRLNDAVYQEGRSFVTKLWNAFRLILMNIGSEGLRYDGTALAAERTEDRWVLSRLGETVRQHDQLLGQNNFSGALDLLATFFWNEYCDWYLEIIKPRMRAGGEERRHVLSLAVHCQRTMLKLFHPYVPFVTEELWQLLRGMHVTDASGDEACLALARWPAAEDFARAEAAEEAMRSMMSIVRGLRDIRHNLNLPPRQPVEVKLHYLDEPRAAALQSYAEITGTLAAVTRFEKFSGSEAPRGHVPFRFEGGVGYLVLPADFDLAAFLGRVSDKLKKLEQSLAGVEQRLNNEAFLKGAPPAIIEDSRRKAAEYAQAIEKLRQFQASLA